MIGNILMVIGCIFIGFSMIGILRNRNIYTKLLLISKVDTVATLTIIAALILKLGLTMETVKLILLTAFLMITNPVNTHMIARAAWLNGVPLEDREGDAL